MGCLVLADLLVLVHFGFVWFAVLGGLLVLKWKRCVLFHLPAVLWAAVVEFTGWVCPLTPLEIWLREKGRGQGYAGGFIEHYLVPVLYPERLTRTVGIILGLLVILINLGIYWWLLRQKYASRNGLIRRK